VGTQSAGTVIARAYVDPGGAAAAWHFQYLPDAEYEANLAAGREAFSGAASAPSPGQAPTTTVAGEVSWQLTGLVPSTPYRLRAVAENEAGAAVTLAPPLFFTASDQIECEGDACQPLPSPPAEQAVTTLVPGLGNPPVRYVDRRPAHHGHRKHHHRRRSHHRRHPHHRTTRR